MKFTHKYRKWIFLKFSLVPPFIHHCTKSKISVQCNLMFTFPLLSCSWLDLCMPVTWSVFSWRRKTAVSTDTYLSISGVRLSLALTTKVKNSLKTGKIWHSCEQVIVLKDILFYIVLHYLAVRIVLLKLPPRDLWTTCMSQSHCWKSTLHIYIYVSLYVGTFKFESKLLKPVSLFFQMTALSAINLRWQIKPFTVCSIWWIGRPVQILM